LLATCVEKNSLKGKRLYTLENLINIFYTMRLSYIYEVGRK